MKKLFMIIALLVFLPVLAKMVAETFFIKIERLEVPISALPPALDGYRILHISDLHGRRLAGEGRLVSEIKTANPDLIVLTGDYVKRKAWEIDNYFAFLEAIAKIAPVYAVSGNHDHRAGWEKVAGTLQEAGVTVLDNQYARLQKDGRDLLLVGVGDPQTGHDNLSKAWPPEVSSPVILLVHAPTWFVKGRETGVLAVANEEYALLENVDLILTGHTHGGQIKLPLIGAVTTALGRLFPRDYVEGLSREGNAWLYISRGCGQSGIIPLRFLSHAEMTIITLRASDPY